MRRRLLAAAALTGALGLLFGCAHGNEPDIATLASSSDQVIFEAGMKALEKKQWDSARQHFQRIIDGFPQSQYGPAARLALGDGYFREGDTANSILAINQYREFLRLYPSHPRSDYAQFQIGEAYFAQKNGPDRDQTSTEHALEEYERLLELHPGSTYVEPARTRIVECRNTLAEAEFRVGYFYQRTRQAYRAAITRYEGILKDYPDYVKLDQVLCRLGESLALSGRGAEARPHFARLLEEYPQSECADEARQMLGVGSGPAPASTQNPAPSPSPTPVESPPAGGP